MGGLFSKPKPVQVPPPKPPKAIPDEDDPRVKLARRRKIAAEVQESGRTSTLLNSAGRETLGSG